MFIIVIIFFCFLNFVIVVGVVIIVMTAVYTRLFSGLFPSVLRSPSYHQQLRVDSFTSFHRVDCFFFLFPPLRAGFFVFLHLYGHACYAFNYILLCYKT